MLFVFLWNTLFAEDSKAQIASLVMTDRYVEAEKKLLDSKASYAEHWLSLVYRLERDYEKEKILIEVALKKEPESLYFKQRKAWHALPMSDKTQFRKPVHFPRDPQSIPSKAMMQNLCIVTGCDKNYFSLLLELIASVKNTRFYKDVPICIIDCGLTPEQCQILLKEWGVHAIKDPGWDVPVLPHLPQYFKAMTGRAFLDKHFPDFRYYLWIDCDAWVHNECVLDRFVCLAARQGCAMSAVDCYNIVITPARSIPVQDWGAICFKKHINVGLFCVDSQSGFFDRWGAYIRKVVQSIPFRYMTEEDAANYVYYQSGLTALDNKENYTVLCYGNPVVDQKYGALYDALTYEPVGVLHLAMHKVSRNLTHPIYYFPTCYSTKPLHYLHWQYHRLLSLYWHFYPPTPTTTYLMPRRVDISLRYRVWREESVDDLKQAFAKYMHK